MIFMLFFDKALTAAFLSFNVNLENQITFCFSIKIHFLSDPFVTTLIPPKQLTPALCNGNENLWS